MQACHSLQQAVLHIYFFLVRALQTQLQAQMGPSRHFHLNSVSLLGLWFSQEQSRSSAKLSCCLWKN